MRDYSKRILLTLKGDFAIKKQFLEKNQSEEMQHFWIYLHGGGDAFDVFIPMMHFICTTKILVHFSISVWCIFPVLAVTGTLTKLLELKVSWNLAEFARQKVRKDPLDDTRRSWMKEFNSKSFTLTVLYRPYLIFHTQL